MAKNQKPWPHPTRLLTKKKKKKVPGLPRLDPGFERHGILIGHTFLFIETAFVDTVRAWIQSGLRSYDAVSCSDENESVPFGIVHPGALGGSRNRIIHAVTCEIHTQ